MGKFKDKIVSFIVDVEEENLNIVREAIQDMVADMQTPRGAKGGKMPVDTGFLRWSGVAMLNAWPVGPVRGRKRNSKDTPNAPLPEYTSNYADELQIVLAKMELGDTFYWGWTAQYAYKQEMKCGFVDSATMNWDRYIQNAAKKVSK